MGLFSKIGKIAGGLIGGPVGAALGVTAGGFLDAKQDQKDAQKERRIAIEDQINKLPRLRQSAEKAGFNPLTALMATGGNMGGGLPSGMAPLSSNSALLNGFQSLGDELSGKAEQDRQRQSTRDQIEKLELEKLKAGDVGKISKNTSQIRLGGNRVTEKTLPVTQQEQKIGPFRIQRVKPEEFVGKETLKMPKDVTNQHQGPIYYSYTLENGDVIRAPVGPDIDEMVSGTALVAAGKFGHGFQFGSELMRATWGLNPVDPAKIKDAFKNAKEFFTPEPGKSRVHPHFSNRKAQ